MKDDLGRSELEFACPISNCLSMEIEMLYPQNKEEF